MRAARRLSRTIEIIFKNQPLELLHLPAQVEQLLARRPVARSGRYGLTSNFHLAPSVPRPAAPVAVS